MLNIRGLIAVTALSPIIIASTLGLSLSACAPKSRFRPPVNVGGLPAPDDKSRQADPNNKGAGALNTLSPAELERLKQDQAAKLGDGSTDESKLKLQTAGQIAKSIESVIADVDTQSGNLVVNITSKSEQAGADKEKTTGLTLEFKGNISELLNDAKPSVELTPAEGQAKNIKAVATKVSLTPNGSEDQKSNNLILGIELTGYGSVPLLVTLNSDNGLKAVRLSEDNKIIETAEGKEKSVLDGATATTTVSTSLLPNDFSRINTIIVLSNGSAISLVGSYEVDAKLGIIVDDENLKKELATEGRIVKLQLPSPESAQEGIVVEIPYVDTKKPALRLAIGTQENISKLLKETSPVAEATAPTEASPAAQAEAELESPPAPANLPNQIETSAQPAKAETQTQQSPQIEPSGTEQNDTKSPEAPTTTTPTASTTVVTLTNGSINTAVVSTAVTESVKPTEFIYQRVDGENDAKVYNLYKVLTLESGLRCYVQRTSLVPGTEGIKSLAIHQKGTIPSIWTSALYKSEGTEAAFSFDRDDESWWSNFREKQNIASFDSSKEGAKKVNVYVRDEDFKTDACPAPKK